MQTIKRFKNKVSAFLLTIAIALSFVLGAIGFITSPAAHADDDTVEYAPTAAGISNEHFSSSSGSYPANPSSWTGAALDGGNGGVVSGVVDLSGAYFGTDTGNKEFHLDQYPEYADDKDKPQTIFGANSKYTGSDEKALLINTKKGAEIAYAYSSGDMSFSPNSFYRISTWVKTGDFAQDTGATVKLTGLNQSCAFLNINTVKNLKKVNGVPELTEKNNYGWVKYTFYVRTSAAYTRTVKLVLGVGDSYNGDDEDPIDVVPRPAHGYALFDTVSAERISAHDFATETLSFTKIDNPEIDNVYTYSGVNGEAIAIDLYEPTSFTAYDSENDKTVEIGTFSNESDLGAYWEQNVKYDENSDENNSTGFAYSRIYNSESIIPDLESDANFIGFTKNPWAPLGRAEYNSVIGDIAHPMLDGTNANILLIKNPSNAAYGVASPTVKIERYKYYRFSVWIKDDKLTGSAGIGIVIKGKRDGANNFLKIGEYSGLTGDSSDTAHYGWKQHVVYIKGSMLYDYTAKFEFWLGTPSAKASGIAMFDNVTFDELSYSQYSQMSSADNGNVLSNLDVTPVDTGISNGNFNGVGDFENDEITFPMPVADWTYITPATAETKGYSHDNVDTDNAIHGIIPTDEPKFNEISASGAIPMITNPKTIAMAGDMTSALVLSSTTPTAFGYRSSAITVSSGSAYKITADIAVDNVTDGNGAMLILKTTAGNVISTIQNITDTYNAYRTYTFYVNAPLSGQSLYLEIWLGHDHRNGCVENLSNGSVYVKRAGVEEWTAEGDGTIDAEYAELLAKYKTDIATTATRNHLDYGVYSFGAPTLDYYDVYSYAENDGLGVPYQWSVSRINTATKSGIINADDTKNLKIAGFDPTDMTGNILVIQNLEANRTAYTFDNTVTFAANSYYRLDIDVRVDLAQSAHENDKMIGAVLSLTGSNTAEFSNIKDTSTLIAKNDKEESRDWTSFKTYSFYIAAGDNGGDVGLTIALGGADTINRIQGKLFVKNIVLTEIDNLEFEDAENDTDNEYVRAVTLSTADEDEDGENSDNDTTGDDENAEAPSGDIQWWIIPTIIFSAALLAVVAIICVVKLREYFQKKRKKKATYSTEYDRANTMRDLERLQAQSDSDAAAAGKVVPELDTVNDELDDYDVPATETNDAAPQESEEPAENDDVPAAENTEEPANAEEKPEAPKTSSDDLDD